MSSVSVQGVAGRRYAVASGRLKGGGTAIKTWVGSSWFVSFDWMHRAVPHKSLSRCVPVLCFPDCKDSGVLGEADGSRYAAGARG